MSGANWRSRSMTMRSPGGSSIHSKRTGKTLTAWIYRMKGLMRIWKNMVLRMQDRLRWTSTMLRSIRKGEAVIKRRTENNWRGKDTFFLRYALPNIYLNLVHHGRIYPYSLRSHCRLIERLSPAD